MSAASQNRSSKYGSGPRYWPLPCRSARLRWTSAASSRRAGMATKLLAVVVRRGDRPQPGVDPHHVRAEARPDRQEGQPVRGGAQPPHEHRLVELHQLERPALAGRAEVRFERDRVEGDEGGDQLPDPAGGGEQADVRAAVRDDGQIGDRRTGAAPAPGPSACGATPSRRCRGSCRCAAGRRPRRRSSSCRVIGCHRPHVPACLAEGVADPVGDPAEVRLEGEALLEAVAAAYVDGVDAVDGGLGQPEQPAVLRGDLRAPAPVRRRAVRRAGRPATPSRARAARRRSPCARCSTARASGAGGPAGPDGWPRPARPGPARAARRWRPRSPRSRPRCPTRPMPPPRQNPCTAATTGTSHSYTAANASRSRGWRRSAPCAPAVALHLLDVHARVEPAPLGGQHDTADLGVAAAPRGRRRPARTSPAPEAR